MEQRSRRRVINNSLLARIPIAFHVPLEWIYFTLIYVYMYFSFSRLTKWPMTYQRVSASPSGIPLAHSPSRIFPSPSSRLRRTTFGRGEGSRILFDEYPPLPHQSRGIRRDSWGLGRFLGAETKESRVLRTPSIRVRRQPCVPPPHAPAGLLLMARGRKFSLRSWPSTRIARG